ncbi:hypothetical protein D3C75_1154190 [compost metagenome]
MLVGGMVQHQVQNQLHPPGMNLPEQLVEILHGAVFRSHGLVVGDVVAVVVIGGLVGRTNPDDADPQLL